MLGAVRGSETAALRGPGNLLEHAGGDLEQLVFLDAHIGHRVSDLLLDQHSLQEPPESRPERSVRRNLFFSAENFIDQIEEIVESPLDSHLLFLCLPGSPEGPAGRPDVNASGM
ncbi:hypothetical protein [Microbispora sp. CSR-4]|uniref:hypothetical protein n=1 Tax=Microbispora sp. CSR-4 TaxID=2592813 RepID=UPI0011C94FC4|nr:hypothetical protein [Microbispora sp. CSR-4]